MKFRHLILLVFFLQSSNIFFGQTGEFSLRGKITDSTNYDFNNYNCKIFIYNDNEIVAVAKTDFVGKYRFDQLNPNLSKSLKIKLKYINEKGVSREIFVPESQLSTTKKRIQSDKYIEFNFDFSDTLITKNNFLANESSNSIDSNINYKLPTDRKIILSVFKFNEEGTFYRKKLITKDTTHFKYINARYGVDVWSVNNCLYINNRSFPEIDLKSFKIKNQRRYYYPTYLYFTDTSYAYVLKELPNGELKLTKLDLLERSKVSFVNDIFCDFSTCYLRDSLLTFKNEKVTYIGGIFYKTKTRILLRYQSKNNPHIYSNVRSGAILDSILPYFKNYINNETSTNTQLFYELYDIDPYTFKFLTNNYYYDKNGCYYNGIKLNVSVIDSINFKIINFKNYQNIFTDGKTIYKDGLKTNFDPTTFSVKTESVVYDKNGIYYMNNKIQFDYKKEIKGDSIYVVNNGIIYDNQYFIPSFSSNNYRPKIVNISSKDKKAIIQNKMNTLVYKSKSNKPISYFYDLKIKNNKLYYLNKKCDVDFKSFQHICGDYFRDKNEFYLYQKKQGLTKLKTLIKEIKFPIQFINIPQENLLIDNEYIYLDTIKLMKLQKIESLKQVLVNDNHYYYLLPEESFYGRCGAYDFDRYRLEGLSNLYKNFILKNGKVSWYLTICYTYQNTELTHKQISLKKIDNTFMNQINQNFNEGKIYFSELFNSEKEQEYLYFK
jgi:hypothetical protein